MSGSMAGTVSAGPNWSSIIADLKSSQFHGHSFHSGSPPTRSDRRTVISAAHAGTCKTSAGLVATRDHFYTLGVTPGASEQEIKKAYRRLALQFHPDVCQEDYCASKFMQINKAYEIVMNGGLALLEDFSADSSSEGFMGVNDDSWEDWEEWMGWEGAGTLDYSSHINLAL